MCTVIFSIFHCIMLGQWYIWKDLLKSCKKVFIKYCKETAIFKIGFDCRGKVIKKLIQCLLYTLFVMIFLKRGQYFFCYHLRGQGRVKKQGFLNQLFVWLKLYTFFAFLHQQVFAMWTCRLVFLNILDMISGWSLLWMGYCYHSILISLHLYIHT